MLGSSTAISHGVSMWQNIIHINNTGAGLCRLEQGQGMP